MYVCMYVCMYVAWGIAGGRGYQGEPYASSQPSNHETHPRSELDVGRGERVPGGDARVPQDDGTE